MRPRRLNAIEQMQAATTRLLEGTRDVASWEWDQNYWAALAIIKAPHEEAILDLVAEALPHCWDPLEIRYAPEPIRRAGIVSIKTHGNHFSFTNQNCFHERGAQSVHVAICTYAHGHAR